MLCRLCSTSLPNLASFAVVPAWLHPSPLPHRSRWRRPVNHGFTLQSELFRQVLCEAALSSPPKVGQPAQMLHGHVPVSRARLKEPKDSHTGRMNVQVCVSTSHESGAKVTPSSEEALI